jgi:REP element-mobilizing transposase RayT
MNTQTYAARPLLRRPGAPYGVKTFHVRLGISGRENAPMADPGLANALIAAARRHHELGRWWCELILVMPDHIHAILSVGALTGLSGSMNPWKRETSLALGFSWREEHIEDRIWRRSDADERFWYVRHNPVARGLCDADEDWPFWWSALSPMG